MPYHLDFEVSRLLIKKQSTGVWIGERVVVSEMRTVLEVVVVEDGEVESERLGWLPESGVQSLYIEIS